MINIILHLYTNKFALRDLINCYNAEHINCCQMHFIVTIIILVTLTGTGSSGATINCCEMNFIVSIKSRTQLLHLMSLDEVCLF